MHRTGDDSAANNRLAKKLLVYIVLISSTITLLLTALQLLLQYREQLAEIEQQISLIESSYLQSLITSVWAIDQGQIHIQLEGLRHLPYVETARIMVNDEPRWSSGRQVSASVQRVQIPLSYYYNDKNTQIGTLQITFSLDRVYRSLINNAAVILASNAVKTFLVAGILLFIFNRLIGQPLTALADFANNLDLQRLSGGRLRFERRFWLPHNKPDEIDALVQALQQMHERLLAGLQERERIAAAQRRLEQELNRQKDRLAQLERVAMVGELSTGIAHEINQPLVVISGYTDICRRALQSGKPDLELLAGVLEKIYGETHRASGIIRSLRNLADTRQSERRMVRVDELLEECLMLNTAKARTRGSGLTLTAEPDDSLCIEADPLQLQLVLRNLIDNALDAAGPQSPAAGAAIRISAAADETGFIRIGVSDHGCGVNDADTDRIFDPLFTTKPRGMGIGLALCRTIAEAHGGELGFHNNPEGGATFYLLLPLLDV